MSLINNDIWTINDADQDESNQTVFRIHIRNDLGQMQIRMNNLKDRRRTTGQWQDFENKGLISLEW